MAGTNIVYDGHSLQSSTVLTDDIDHNSISTKNATYYQLAHANKSALPFVSYPTKIIPITGTLVGSSIANLDSVIDTFKSYFNGKDKNLDIDWNGSTRRYIATAIKVDIKRPGGLAYATFAVTFQTSNGWGQDTTTTTALSATGRTNASYSDTETILGSAPWQSLVATITLTAITGVSGTSVAFGNSTTGQTCTITDSNWNSGDVVVIDPTSDTPVTVNAEAHDFSGAIPQFAPGLQTLTYNDNFTTRTFNISVVYYALYA